MRDFWDLNNDGELDIWEKSMRDATILTILEEDKDEDVCYTSSRSSSGGANAFGTFLLILGILLLLGACAG